MNDRVRTHRTRTNLYSNEFRWNEKGELEQKVQCIQHYADDSRDVGMFTEWHTVKVDDEPVIKMYPISGIWS